MLAMTKSRWIVGSAPSGRSTIEMVALSPMFRPSMLTVMWSGMLPAVTISSTSGRTIVRTPPLRMPGQFS